MEEVLLGCDIGALGISNKHWVPFLAMAQGSNSATHNHHWHQC